MLKISKIEYRIGVDIGGTKMGAVLLNGERVIGESKLATPKDDLEKFLVMLNALIEPLKEQAQKDKVRIKGIGIGVPGAISDGKIVYIPNLPFLKNLSVSTLAEKIGAEIEIKIDNDANCFALGEAVIGAGKNFNNVYGLIIGTGIGGGWIVDGKTYQGSHGAANEPGAMIIDFNSRMNLEGAYHKLTQNNPALLAEEAYSGDVLAREVFEELGRILGVGIANIINLFDPEVLVIGGGATDASELFMSEIKKTIKGLVENQGDKEIKVVKAKLGKLAGAIGAALLIA
ncbi:MAG: ROK family protein [bacterium]